MSNGVSTVVLERLGRHVEPLITNVGDVTDLLTRLVGTRYTPSFEPVLPQDVTGMSLADTHELYNHGVARVHDSHIRSAHTSRSVVEMLSARISESEAFQAVLGAIGVPTSGPEAAVAARNLLVDGKAYVPDSGRVKLYIGKSYNADEVTLSGGLQSVHVINGAGPTIMVKTRVDRPIGPITQQPGVMLLPDAMTVSVPGSLRVVPHLIGKMQKSAVLKTKHEIMDVVNSATDPALTKVEGVRMYKNDNVTILVPAPYTFGAFTSSFLSDSYHFIVGGLLDPEPQMMHMQAYAVITAYNRGGVRIGDHLSPASRSILLKTPEGATRQSVDDETYGPLAQRVLACDLWTGLQLSDLGLDPLSTYMRHCSIPLYVQIAPRVLAAFYKSLPGTRDDILDRFRGNFLSDDGRLVPITDEAKFTPDDIDHPASILPETALGRLIAAHGHMLFQKNWENPQFGRPGYAIGFPMSRLTSKSVHMTPVFQFVKSDGKPSLRYVFYQAGWRTFLSFAAYYKPYGRKQGGRIPEMAHAPRDAKSDKEVFLRPARSGVTAVRFPSYEVMVEKLKPVVEAFYGPGMMSTPTGCVVDGDLLIIHRDLILEGMALADEIENTVVLRTGHLTFLFVFLMKRFRLPASGGPRGATKVAVFASHIRDSSVTSIHKVIRKGGLPGVLRFSGSYVLWQRHIEDSLRASNSVVRSSPRRG